MLTGLNVLNYLDRYVGAAVLPLVIAGLHLSDGQAGNLQSAFILVYSLMSPVAGWWGDRKNRLHLAALGVVLWSLATFGSGLAPTFAVLLLARALVGVGEASYGVVTPSLLSDLYPATHRGRALAIFYAAVPVGSALGYMLGGAVGSAYGWQTAFFVAGGPGLLLALALLLLREPSRGRFDPLRSDAAIGLSLGASWRALRARPSYLVNTAAQTVYTFSMGGLAYWMPTYFVRERGLRLDRATFLFGLCLVVSGFLGTILGGYLGDRYSARNRAAHFVFSGWALVLSVPFTLMAVLASDPAIFWSGMFITLLLLFLNTGPLNAAMSNVLPPELRARGFGLYTMAIHLLGDGLSPTLIGVASDAVGLRLPVLLTGLLLAAAGVILLVGQHTLTRDLQAEAT